MDDQRQVLLALAGDKPVVKALPADSPLAKHLPAARKAIEAFCQGDDAAMTEALKQIPFRSPYRDLRWLLEALAAYPAHKETGLQRLERISASSPLQGPATVARALLTGGNLHRHKAVREFVAAFQAASAQDARTLFLALMEQARLHPDPRLAAVLKALLVHHPKGLNAYQRLFGPLNSIERRRLIALHEERYGDPFQAYGHWVDIGAAYDQKGEKLRAAAVARHLAEMARRFWGSTDAEVGRNLINANRFDPDDRDTWLELVEYFRLADDQKQRCQVVDVALQRFPDDPKVIAAAARTAFDRGSYKKSARLYARLLQLDPINRETRQRLIQTLMVQARKQLQRGHGDLARKELREAMALADDDHSRARVLALQGMVERITGNPAAVESCFDRARALLPPPLGDWTVTATALALKHSNAEIKPLLKTLRQVMAHAALQGPDKTVVLTLLHDAASLLEADEAVAQTLLKTGSRYFKKALTLDWSLEEIRELGDLLLHLECWQWLRDLVRGHKLWSKQEPLLVYLDAEAKCRGMPENLNPYEVRRLSTALDAAAEAGQSWLAQRIDALIQAQAPARSPFGPSDAKLEELARENDMTPGELLQAILGLFGGVFDRRTK